MPAFAEDGGEESEVVGLYVIGDQGEPWRVGFALGNEYSDHKLERQNYLYLAHSKLRQCSFGPELFIGDLPDHVEGATPHWLLVAAVGAILGFLTGFLGVGGGFLIVPALVFALGYSMRNAIATSLFVIFVNTVVALGSRFGHAPIAWGACELLVLAWPCGA